MATKCEAYPDDDKLLSHQETALEAFRKVIDEKEVKCRTDDTFLLGFLCAANFDVEKSLHFLKIYYSARKNYPEIFKDLLPSKLEHVLPFKFAQFLPNRDHEGRYIFIIEVANWDASSISVLDYFRCVQLHMDFQWNFSELQKYGVVFIVNAAGFSYKHFFQITPRIINAGIAICFKSSAYHSCFREVHYVNINILMRTILRVMNPFFPDEIKRLLYFHSDIKSLHKFVNPRYLPADYGGELPCFDPTEANEMLRKHEEYFRMNEEYCNSYDGSRIP